MVRFSDLQFALSRFLSFRPTGRGGAPASVLPLRGLGPLQITWETKHMRSLTAFFVLLGFMASAALARAQGTEPASQSAGSTPVAATKAEVSELRSEVAAQRKTIDELKALVEKLAEGKSAAVNNGSPQIRPVADSSSTGPDSQPIAAPSQRPAPLKTAVLLEWTSEAAAVLGQSPAAAPPKKGAPLAA